MRTRLALLVALGAVSVLAPAAAESRAQQSRTLIGVVGTNDSFQIALTDGAGNPVSVVRPGTYTLRISDRSRMHNFHLFGPNVDIRTDVPATGETTREVTFQRGAYAYVCDPHPRTMRGTFAVEAAPRPVPTSVVADMDAREEVPRPKGQTRLAAGLFTGAVTRTGSTGSIRWRLTFERLTGRAVAAHIHFGRPGRAGGVAAPLCGPCRSGMRRTTTLSARVMRAVLRRAAYVNVHTRRNPAGEIRGQLQRMP